MEKAKQALRLAFSILNTILNTILKIKLFLPNQTALCIQTLRIYRSFLR